MNILHVVNIYFVLPYFIGGQFKYFAAKGHKMHVACSPSEYLDDYAKENGFDYIETSVNRSISIKEDLVSIFNIYQYIKDYQIDIVIGHTPKGGLLAMIAGKMAKVPKRIYFRHGLVYETSKGLKRFILKTVDRIASACATKIICVSPSVLRRSIEDNLAPGEKQMILGRYGTCNGVDTIQQFNPDRIDKKKVVALRNKYAIESSDFIIGYSGRLVKDKGIIELVEAFERFDDKGNCKLLLVGMFEKRDSLPDEIQRRINDNPRIIYTGFVNGGMELYYSLMDVYVLPSYREGFPTGVLEAQAMALPVITTRVTGCCDSIIVGETGLFVDNNSDDLYDKINLIREHKVIDGKKGRKWVVENFDSRLIWHEIEKLY